MNTDNTFNQLVADTFIKVNDEVYCTLLDMGLTPDQSYQIAYVDSAFEDFAGLPVYEIDPSQLEDFDDVILADQ